MFRKTYINFEKVPPHLGLTQKRIKKITGKKIREIRNYFKRYYFKKAVIGVSGGIDSALAATLTIKALGPKNVYFLRMPYLGISSKESLILTEKLAKNLKLPEENLITIPINKQVDLSWKILKKFKGGNLKIRKGNLMARERMKILFDLSAVKRAIVIGSEGKSEERLGYFTIGGDRVSGIEPINNLYKTQVYKMASFFREIPDEILKRAPSPELWKDQTDEGEIGASYLEIDTVLSAIENLKISKKKITKKFKIKKSKIDLILKRYQKAKGKRNLPYVLKL
ncbi:NAD(+) synthase [Patescibacteria group bacterium]|nr:NAD(+) synthase [Patescibacteria group bacterium]